MLLLVFILLILFYRYNSILISYLISQCTGAIEGDPFWDGIRDALLGEPSKEIQDCQNPKPVLFSTGEVRASYNKIMSLSIYPSLRSSLFPDDMASPMAPRNSGCTDHHYWISGHSGSPRRSEVYHERHTKIRFALNYQQYVKCTV